MACFDAVNLSSFNVPDYIQPLVYEMIRAKLMQLLVVPHVLRENTQLFVAYLTNDEYDT